ncbi:MAG: DsbE family thiol:disulfide interchange protein [Gallionella sp.]
MIRYILPFVLFLILSVFLYKGLGRDTREVPSPLIGKAAPAFTLPTLYDTSKHFSPKAMQGKVWLLNIWASWCEACKEEHPVLMAFARQQVVPIVGVDYKDKRDAGIDVMRKAGDPYNLVISDADGKVGFNYGVYGVPETYIIDKIGVIRYKLIGAVTPKNLRETLMPLITELQAK